MKRFTINNKEYDYKEFGIDIMCQLEEANVSPLDMLKKPISFVRTYFEICTGMNTDKANKELEEHVINGGTFDEILDIINEDWEKSDFFQAWLKRTIENIKKLQEQLEENPEKTTEV